MWYPQEKKSKFDQVVKTQKFGQMKNYLPLRRFCFVNLPIFVFFLKLN